MCVVVYSRFRRFVSSRTNSSRSLHFATPRRRGTFRERRRKRETLTARTKATDREDFPLRCLEYNTYLDYTERGVLLAHSRDPGARARARECIHERLVRTWPRTCTTYLTGSNIDAAARSPRWANGKFSNDHAGTYLVISNPPLSPPSPPSSYPSRRLYYLYIVHRRLEFYIEYKRQWHQARCLAPIFFINNSLI